MLLPPIPDPPSERDFYAFEQHVKTVRARRGVEMIPEWYEIPTFYFSNNSEIYGHDEPIPYPVGSNELDIELEIACVIGREGKDIPVEEAAEYIAGYTIMNDWSARDFQFKEMKLNLGPAKGKDFATSIGPWLVTPDELASRLQESGAGERYDMTMIARVNGKEISRGNFSQIYYSFPQMIAYASRNTRLRAGDVLGYVVLVGPEDVDVVVFGDHPAEVVAFGNGKGEGFHALVEDVGEARSGELIGKDGLVTRHGLGDHFAENEGRSISSG